MKKLADERERRIIRSELERNLIVEAAAGTGKTTELVNRIVALIARGRAEIQTIVAVTFTEKAAGELKLRMRGELEKARHETKKKAERGRLEAALARLEEARVGTIHGFCAELLRERSIEALVDPQFEVLTEAESERLLRDVFDLWLQRRLDDPPEGVRRSLRRSAKDGPVERLFLAAHTLVEWRDFPAPWRRPEYAREALIDELVAELHHFADLARRCSNPLKDNFYKDTESARLASDRIARAEALGERDYDGAEAALVVLTSVLKRARQGYGKNYGDGVLRSEVLEARDSLHPKLAELERLADADLAALLQRELLEVIELYRLRKDRKGVLDFLDLLIRARDLLRDDATVRAEFQRRISHIFIDEFQDTDPLQAEILLLLASADPEVTDWRQVEPEPGKLALVADPKQSIYRFRRADVGTYFEVRDLLLRSGAEDVRLTTSFRSVPSIQAAVNTAFAPEMDGDRESLQAEYVPLSPAREDIADQPTLVALSVPKPYGWRRITKGAMEKSMPDAVGAFVDWLLTESGWRVTTRDHPGERVPIEGRHVCLLFRRFYSFFAGDVTRGYVRALEARGVRHLLVGGRSFHEREEVATLRTALTAIEWPEDELAVYATLRGYLFAVGDEELVVWRHRFKRLRPFGLPEEADLPRELGPVRDALSLLASLHRERNRRPVAETIHTLLEATRAHAAFALRPSGEQVLANVLHVAEQARSYDRGAGLSFRGFVERLIEDAGGGRGAEAPILEEGSDGVRIMTVHKAKGLEFPVVILADVTANLTTSSAMRSIDPERGLCAVRIAGWSPMELREGEPLELERDEAESQRLAYVAATRARDLLVLPAVGDEPWGKGWVAALNRAIYPPDDQRSAAVAAPGCPEFGADSVLERPDGGFVLPVKPGLHRFEGHSVVWWDPRKLGLHAESAQGLRHERLLSKQADASVVAADKKRHQEWAEARQATLERGAEPGLAVRTVTEWASSHEGPAPDVELIVLPVAEGRPAGPRFGALVHAILALVPLDAEAQSIGQLAELEGRILGAEDAEVEHGASVVENVLAHELLRRASRAAERGELRRETPVTLTWPDGTLLDGVVDLAFREDGSWTVVDFKTDRELDMHLDTYKQQVALYARAVATATGQPATPVLLRV